MQQGAVEVVRPARGGSAESAGRERASGIETMTDDGIAQSVSSRIFTDARDEAATHGLSGMAAGLG